MEQALIEGFGKDRYLRCNTRARIVFARLTP
jgi:hypothetical protein